MPIQYRKLVLESKSSWITALQWLPEVRLARCRPSCFNAFSVSEWPVGAFAEVMRSHGFTNRELEMMFKDNPAKALGLPVTPENRI